jgi:hypothetical protein
MQGTDNDNEYWSTAGNATTADYWSTAGNATTADYWDEPTNSSINKPPADHPLEYWPRPPKCQRRIQLVPIWRWSPMYGRR